MKPRDLQTLESASSALPWSSSDRCKKRVGLGRHWRHFDLLQLKVVTVVDQWFIARRWQRGHSDCIDDKNACFALNKCTLNLELLEVPLTKTLWEVRRTSDVPGTHGRRVPCCCRSMALPTATGQSLDLKGLSSHRCRRALRSRRSS
jgi:hypothetical protein